MSTTRLTLVERRNTASASAPIQTKTLLLLPWLALESYTNVIIGMYSLWMRGLLALPSAYLTVLSCKGCSEPKTCCTKLRLVDNRS